MGGIRIGQKAVFWTFITMVLLVAACVQPVDNAALVTPAAVTPAQVVPAVSPTPPAAPVQGPSFPPDVIAQWLASNLGATANNLAPFTQLQVGPDDIVGYTFQNSAGNPCVGFVLTTASTFQVWNGDFRCYDANTQAIAGPILFSLTNGEPYAAGFGYVNTALLPSATSVDVRFLNGPNVPTPIFGNGGFVMLRPGLELPAQAVILDSANNEIFTVPVQ